MQHQTGPGLYFHTIQMSIMCLSLDAALISFISAQNQIFIYFAGKLSNMLLIYMRITALELFMKPTKSKNIKLV